MCKGPLSVYGRSDIFLAHSLSLYIPLVFHSNTLTIQNDSSALLSLLILHAHHYYVLQHGHVTSSILISYLFIYLFIGLVIEKTHTLTFGSFYAVVQHMFTDWEKKVGFFFFLGSLLASSITACWLAL